MSNTTAKPRAMVIDDDPVLARMMSRALETVGFTAVVFVSSLAALAAFRATPDQFDLVVTDHAMPELNGDELACRMRTLRPQIPILLITGSLAEDHAEAPGIGGFLEKPFSIRQLKGAIDDLLSSATPRSSAI